MFDVATGTTSTELACAGCQRMFPAGQAVAGRCRACAPSIDAMLAEAAVPKADYTDHQATENDRRFALAVWSFIVFAVSVSLWIYFRVTR